MANDLQTTDRTAATPCSVLASKSSALAKLVDDTHPHFQRLITPAERAELAALLPRYEAALVPATPDYIGKSITMLAVAFPGGKASDEEAKTRHRLYRDGLSDIPADVLDDACRDAIRTCQFFPTVSEIRDRCREAVMRRFRLSRIKHLIAKHDAEWRPADAEERCTPEQAREIRERLGMKFPEDYHNSMGEAA